MIKQLRGSARSFVAAACSAALCQTAMAGDRPRQVEMGPEGYGELVGELPPELVSDSSDWLNVKAPLTLEGLRGKAVWLEFSFIKCGGCQLMKPLLTEWHERFKERDLVVIEVNNGEIDSWDETRAYFVEDKCVEYAVLWDRDGRTCKAFGVGRYPAAYLIGADGTVLWQGDPCKLTVYGQAQEIWKAIDTVRAATEAAATSESAVVPAAAAESPTCGAEQGEAHVKVDDDAYPNGGGPAVTSLEGSIMPLVVHFNQQRETRRFVALVSATCPACIHGARSVRDSILKAYPDTEFSVSIVWIDMLPSDNPRAVARSAHLFNDPRVTQFYDADRRVGELISGALLNEGAGPAWDIYLFYDEGVTWGAAPPAPGEWYHQLSGTRRADPELFRPGQNLIDQLHETAGRWLGVALVPGEEDDQANVEQTLELLYFKGCPNHETLRESLTSAIERCGLKYAVHEVDLASLEESDHRRRFGSPTILFEGRDLFGCAPNVSGALTCRLYEGDECPTPDELCAAVCRVVCKTTPDAACCTSVRGSGSCCSRTGTDDEAIVAKDPNRSDCPGLMRCPLTGELVCKDRCPVLAEESTARSGDVPNCCEAN